MKKLVCVVLTLIMLLSSLVVSADTNYCELFEKTLSCFTWVTEYGNESKPFSANTIAFVTSRQLDFTDRYNADKSSEFDECYSFPKAEFEALAKKLFDVKVDLTTANYSELIDVKYDANTATYDVIAHPRGSSLHYGVYGYSVSGGVYKVYLQMVDGEGLEDKYAMAKCSINGDYAKILSFEIINSLPSLNTLITWPKDETVSQIIGTVSKETNNSDTITQSNISSTISSDVTSNVSSNTSSDIKDTSEVDVFVNQSDLFISADKGVLPTGATVAATKITTASGIEFLNGALKNIAKTYTAYDITALKDNAKIQPNGKLYATFTIPVSYDIEKVMVLYVAEDGTPEEVPFVIDRAAGTVTAELSHLSTYAVIEATDDYLGENNGGSTVTIIILAVVVLGALGFYLWYVKVYKNKGKKR